MTFHNFDPAADLQWDRLQESRLKRQDELDEIAAELDDEISMLIAEKLLGLPSNERDFIRSQLEELRR